MISARGVLRATVVAAMVLLVVSLLLFWTASPVRADLAPVWSSATLYEARNLLSATAAGGKVFFAGGQPQSAVVDIYDTATGTWSTAGLSQARRELAATVSGDKVYFGGGFGGATTYSNVVDIYDTSTGSWSTASLSHGRYELTAAAAGGKVLFAGGFHGSPSAVVDIYDTGSSTWATASLSQARGGLSATAAGGKVFFAGGSDPGSTLQSNVVDIYDTGTGNWSTSTLSHGRSFLAATSAGNKVFFAGGVTGGYWMDYPTTNVVDIYDTVSETWSYATLSEGRAFLAATSVGNEVFFGGGAWYDGTYPSGEWHFSSVVDIYDTVSGNWSTATPLSQGRSYLAAASAGNEALFGGGSWIDGTGFHFSDVVDIYTIPEPVSLVSGAIGLVCVGADLRRRKRRK
ncbi:MAG: hypothetical protein NTX87_05670 [Planctomycetota bacterium]|nr:hypothetical protein [Planctomycetota bacterium]